MDRARLVILAAAALTVVAVPVQAKGDRSACPNRSGCVWDQTGFQGKLAQVPSSGCIDSNIRSAANKSSRPLSLFMGAGCYGPRAGTLQPGQETPQISAGSATGDCPQGPADQCTGDPTPTTSP